MPVPTLLSYASVLQSTQGQALPGATVTVLSGQTDTVNTTTQPGSPLAAIYTDPYGYSQVPQTALNLAGQVVINGTPNVSYSSGNQLSAYLAGNTITINGVQYTVASVNPTAGTLVLTTNAASSGTFAWSATIPITPLMTDGQGNFQFWAAPGYYVVQIYGVQITTQIIQGITVSVAGSDATGITGFGNGSSGQLMTTTLLGSGSGPANPTTAVAYEKVIISAQTYWRPLFQCVLLSLLMLFSFGIAHAQSSINGNYTFTGQNANKGPTPWSDIAAFNAIATNGPFRPTATYTSGNAQITVSNGASFPKNGVGITIQGAGASISMSTPGAPTVTPQYASGPQRDHLMVNSPTGSSTYIYCIVAEDKGQGLTPCSSSTTITNGLATIGEQSATISSESLSNGTLTVNTSSGTFENGMIVDVLSGVPRFSGMMKTNTGTTNSFTVAKYVNDDRVTPQFISDVPNSTSVSGTVNYYQANTIKWTVVTGARRYWICAERPGDASLHVIGQSDMTSGTWQGNQYEDWGSSFLANQSFPFYITDAICTGAGQPDSLTTTVASGAGTTTPTLTVAPSQTNNSNTMKASLDSGPALVAAATQAGNGQGCVYVPPQSNVLNAFRIESFTALASNICIIQAGAIVLDDTLEMTNASWQTWNQVGTAQFGTQGGATVAEQTANPAIHLLGNGNTIRGVSFSSTANAATMITPDSTATKLSANNCYLTNANDTLGICVQYRSINGATATAIIDQGSSFASGLSQTQDASWVPLVDDGPAQDGSGNISGANGYELHIQDLYDSIRTISYSGGGFLSLLHHYVQGPITPIVMYNTSAGGGVSPIYLNDVIGDTTGVAMVANLSNTPNLVIRFDGIIGSTISNPIISGTRPLSAYFGAWAPATTGSNGNIDNSGCTPVTVITGAYEGGGTPPSGVNRPVCKTQSLSIQGGDYPLIAAPLPAPGTPSVSGPSAGGSIPVSTYLYAVSATGFDGGDTMPSPVPSSSITTTNGNQTVTVSWSAVVGAKSYNIWRCDTAAAGGCFTNINGNLPFIGPNWKEVAYHQTGTSFNDTVASPTSSTFATQTATGISQVDANEAIAPQFVSPETTAPSATTGFDQCYGDSTAHALKCAFNDGSFFQQPQEICSGQIALSTGAINSGTRATNMLSCSGLSASTDRISCTFSGDTNAVTGYAPSASGGLTLKTWVSTNTINVDQVNDTGGSITPGAAMINCAGIR